MEDLNDEISQNFDNSDKIQESSLNNALENDISLNLEANIQQQIQEFEVILNNKQSNFFHEENDLNLDEINDLISEHLFNNEELALNVNTTNSTNVDKDIDVISISSTDSQISCGYHSSDFEFISEVEAKRDCLIINFKSNIKDFEDPGEGTSRMNKMAHSILNEYIDRSSNTLKYRRPLINYGIRQYRNNHEIPRGDDYLGLFQGIYDPMLQRIHFMENKSIKTSIMSVEYDGMGFDGQLVDAPHVSDSSEDEYDAEAKENVERILSTYPRDNYKRRRR